MKGDEGGGRKPRARARSKAVEAPRRERRFGDYRLWVMLAAWFAGAVYTLDVVTAALLTALAAGVGALYYRAPEGARRPRRLLVSGAVLLLGGLALVGAGPSEVGMGMTLLALLVMAIGIHTFGRLGPEEDLQGA